jgi:rhodanese-related sulfurtransferase
MVSGKRDDSLRAANEKKLKDSVEFAKKDSVKRVQDSVKTAKDKAKDSVNNQEKKDFVRPVDIKIDFAKALFDKKYRFIDARDISDYNAGHIQAALNVPYHDLEKYRNVLEGLPRDQAYICYCSSACDVSIDLAYAMAKMGFNKVYIFHGGWDEWKAAGYPAN